MATADIGARARVRPSRLLLVAAAGAALGSVWDLFHVSTRTTVYSIGEGRMPLWVPLEFALVYVVGVMGIARLGSPQPDAHSPTRLAAETAWVTIVYAITALGHRHELLVFALAALALLARAPTLRRVVPQNLVPAVALVVAGPVVETILVSAGVFRYTHASLWRVALWLPLLYANAVPFAVRLTEAALHEPARR